MEIKSSIKPRRGQRWLCIKEFKKVSDSQSQYIKSYTPGKIYRSDSNWTITDDGGLELIWGESLLEYFRPIPRNKRWKKDKNEDKIERSP